MRDEFKHKPDQMGNILKAVPQHVHPRRKRYLYDSLESGSKGYFLGRGP